MGQLSSLLYRRIAGRCESLGDTKVDCAGKRFTARRVLNRGDVDRSVGDGANESGDAGPRRMGVVGGRWALHAKPSRC